MRYGCFGSENRWHWEAVMYGVVIRECVRVRASLERRGNTPWWRPLRKELEDGVGEGRFLSWVFLLFFEAGEIRLPLRVVAKYR